jgi:hypothetical protein
LKEGLTELFGLAVQGELKVTIGATYPLERAAERTARWRNEERQASSYWCFEVFPVCEGFLTPATASQSSYH